MIGMRRTLFVVPLDLAAVVKAACTESIAEAQRRRYAKLIEEGGITSNGLAWLDDAADATLRALESRGQAFASRAVGRGAAASREALLRRGQEVGRHDRDDDLGAVSPGRGRTDRARSAARNVDEQPVELDPGGSVVVGTAAGARAGGGAGRPRVTLAGRLRACDGHRPQVVDRVDARADSQRRLPRSVPRRSTSTARPGSPFPTTSRASRTPSRGPRCCPRSTRP